MESVTLVSSTLLLFVGLVFFLGRFKTGLEFRILYPWFLRYWNYRFALPCLAIGIVYFQKHMTRFNVQFSC